MAHPNMSVMPKALGPVNMLPHMAQGAWQTRLKTI